MNEIILADIYDIYPNEEFIKKRCDENNNLNFDCIYNDELLQLSVLYTCIFNFTYNTYPTKKDFNDSTLKSKSIEFTKNLCDNIIENMYVYKQNIYDYFMSLKNKIKDKQFIINVIINKLNYRYNVLNKQDIANSVVNLYEIIMKIYDLYIPIENINYYPDYNTITGYRLEDKILDENDMNILIDYEIIQYVLYKDYCFLKELKDSAMIIADTTNNIKLIQTFIKSFNISYMLLELPINKNFIKDDIIKIPINLYHLIPQICEYHLTISDSIYPEYYTKSENSFYFSFNNKTNQNKNIKYKKYLSNDILSNYLLFPYNLEKDRLLNNEDIMIEYWKGYEKLDKYGYVGSDKKHIYYNNLLRYIVLNFDFMNNRTLKHNKINEYNNVIILIDNRKNYMSIMSFIISLNNLDNTWRGILYTSKDAYDFYNKYLGEIIDIKILVDLNKKFDIDIYNSILMNNEFWENLKIYNRCLIIQDDGILMKNGIKEFMKYDYIGAPWIDNFQNEQLKKYHVPTLIGNGGFSLRNPKVMLEILNKFYMEKTQLFLHNYIKIPEDVYFSKYILKINNAVLPSYETATKFSSEQILNNNSIGFHRIWHYHNYQDLKKYFNK